MRKLLSISSLLLFWLPRATTAQVHIQVEPLGPLKLSYGVRVGGQLTGMTAAAPDFRALETRNNYWGGQAGLVFEAALGWLSLQPAIVFTQKGYREKQTGTIELQGVTYKNNSLTYLRLNYLVVPVNMVATVHGVQLLAGPYLGVGLSGHYHDEFDKPMRTSEYYQTYAATSFKRDSEVTFGKVDPYAVNAFRRLDAGYQVGIGYKLGSWQAQATYSHGVKNVYPSPYIGYNPQSKNRGFMLDATYFFANN
ncbi:outer membrane beta-barrel protein [Hymenobacter taeanensis]|uniref:Outer membrane beta-barrel protein n=1 Tax=Hymenobacter taeanensis TaxID=2735321 RepID=A0A6M6BG76_9BACT|nr:MULTISPECIES: outer membrane beta-barrel protein [Hymenobacter]QJX46989.1 outer membrane beta-barrel protein [Hymenobacter taeanensis]UOQ80865.1 PorT family protein [Hymenobacter sp. 5414T-23]